MHRSLVQSIVVIFICTICQPIFAGVTSFEHSIRRNWSTEDGLPQISITDIAQDQQGFLWLTTEGGLVRFDGMNFISFDGDDSALLSNPLLRAVVVEQDNSVLFASSIKLIRYDNHIFSELKWQNQSIEGVKDLVITTNNEVLIAADQLYFLRNNQIEKSNEFKGSAQALFVYGDQVYIGGVNQLALYQQNKLEPIAVNWPSGNTTVTKIAMYQQELYIGTNRGLYKLTKNGDLKAQQFAAGLANAEILKLYVDQAQNFWISTYDALYRVHHNQIAEKIVRQSKNSVDWVVSTFEDEDGYLWFGSKSNGLNRLRQDSTKHYSTEFGLPDPFVWSLLVANDRLFVGHNQGLAEFRDDKFVPIKNAELLPNKVVYTMYFDHHQRWWLGTRSGLAIAAIENDAISITHNFPELANTQINGIVEDSAHNIWIASYDGLYRYANEKLESLSDHSGMTNRKIRFVFVDSTDQLWVGTEQGLYKKTENRFELVGDEQLKRSHVTFIGESSDRQNLVVGTFQSGFAYLHNNEVNWFDATRGVPAKSALYIQPIKSALLVANLDGIYVLPEGDVQSASTLSPHIILLDKGGSARVDSYRCCNGAGNAKGAFWRGHIWLPTLAGVVAVDTAAVTLQSRLPKPVFDGLYSENTKYTAVENLLPASARDWRIDFTAPNFYRSSSLEFRYQLLGYDTKWQEVDSRRQAFYTNLPPGKYEFLVQCRYQGEQQWSQPLRIVVELEAYWYESIWVKVVALIATILSGYAIFLLRVKQLANAKARLEAMIEARTNELERSNQQLAELNSKLEQASHTDTLTSLHNRRYLNNWLDLISHQHTQELPLLQIILIDLDNFKQINDNYGHLVGDEILVAMATLLKQEIRSTDHVVRWGGEEFLVIQENSLSSREFVTRLQRKISVYQWPHLEIFKDPVRCSMGVVTHPAMNSASWNWDATLTLADKALYLVKTHGKDGWLQLTPTSTAPADLAAVMSTYSELELAKSDWFTFDGSPRTLKSITQTCRAPT